MKSADLQGLRGIAVIAVVFFHVKADYVDRGFLGVDIFFVLSGYFMAHSMAGVKVDRAAAVGFYKRRLKRLLPSYAIILFLIVFAMPFFLILRELDLAYFELLLSFGIAINFKFGYEHVSYFRKDQFFSSVVMHLWSLAVEMQFYLVVPLIYLLVNRYQASRSRLLILLSIATASLLSYCLESNSQVRFFHLHNRLWEFVAGFIAYEVAQELQQSDKLEKEHSSARCSMPIIISFCCTIALLWLLSGAPLPQFLHATSVDFGSLRVITCALTAAVIVAASCSEGNKLLSMRWLVYIGDISYVLYLVHWPIIVFEHTISVTKVLYTPDIIIVLIISLALAVLMHHLVEKPLLARKFETNMKLVAVIYGIAISTIVFNIPHFVSARYTDWCQHGNSTLRAAMEWNHLITTEAYWHRPSDCSIHDEDFLRMTTWRVESSNRCVAKSNGTLEVLVIGNSVALSSFETVHAALAGRYKTLRLFVKTAPGSCPAGYSRAVREVLYRMRPDVLLFTGYHDEVGFSPDNPAVLEHVKEFGTYIKAHSRVAMIDLPYFLPLRAQPAYGISHYLARGNTDLRIFTRSAAVMQQEQAVIFSRLEALRGDNIVFNNITHSMCREGICYGYDTRTLKAYNNFNMHLNKNAYQLMETTYRYSIERVLNMAMMKKD